MEQVHVQVWDGPEAVLTHARALQEFASSVGQPGSMHWLRYFLQRHEARGKHPYLVMVTRAGADMAALAADDLRGAALFFEYRVRGFRTRAFATDDATGLRAVVARPEWREAVALFAGEALLARGAHAVLTTYEPADPEDAAQRAARLPKLHRNVRLGVRERLLDRDLILADTYNDTLARMGKSTRTNLRYYRKRLRSRMELELVSDARGLLSKEELEQLNRESLNPVEPAEFSLQVDSAATLPGSFVLGLRRTADGAWLSLVGGWRQADTSVVLWQMNAAGYERDSLCTVMRAYLLEHEVNLGMRRLVLYGGTNHAMRHSFEEHRLYDLLVLRKSVRGLVLRRLAKLFASPRSVTGRQNFMAEALRSKDVHWSDADPRVPQRSPRPRLVPRSRPSSVGASD